MNLLVVGANGLLGSNVIRVGLERGWNVSGTYNSVRPRFDIPLLQFDLEEYELFNQVIVEHEPDVVVNCAAMTDVNTCEIESKKANLLNGEAPGGIAADCKTYGIDFVHVSTDYVFNGEADQPYDEIASPDPLQAYGKSKLAGEQAVNLEYPTALVARLSFVWGIHRNTGALAGFPSWVRTKINSEEPVSLYTDQWVTPTRAGQAAETLLDLVEKDRDKYYHMACQSCVTPYEFGAVIADQMGKNTDLLSEGSVDETDQVAPRPTYTCMDVDRVEDALGREQPTLQDDVDAVWDRVS
ncbi:NAD(P)-dependent oxidoreductase [Halosimplex litoreum]|uniref:NAD(P)-dependent oxidoreductase n=1 Tax=Halosimplex litoreum TaxID=1198301 RepID=A0A7T3KVD5_9EURY|nr:NAD(P)-dependent oxidoreductase [Halosimplex litoreum]QPV63209.1 NAD(P)-dependent oxidoreductase [Halosimplex litoreum]